MDLKPLCIELGLASSLSKNGVLKWTLKSILAETNNKNIEPELRSSTSLDTHTKPTQLKLKSVATDVEAPKNVHIPIKSTKISNST